MLKLALLMHVMILKFLIPLYIGFSKETVENAKYLYKYKFVVDYKFLR